jgi:hypothetical protein
MYYIMRAAHLASTPRKQSIKVAIEYANPNTTVLVATRHYSWNKSSPVFILGSGRGYETAANPNSKYTVDTGNGYRFKGERLEIHNIIEVNEYGAISLDGHYIDPDGCTLSKVIGENIQHKNANIYVMK